MHQSITTEKNGVHPNVQTDFNSSANHSNSNARIPQIEKYQSDNKAITNIENSDNADADHLLRQIRPNTQRQWHFFY